MMINLKMMTDVGAEMCCCVCSLQSQTFVRRISVEDPSSVIKTTVAEYGAVETLFVRTKLYYERQKLFRMCKNCVWELRTCVRGVYCCAELSFALKIKVGSV